MLNIDIREINDNELKGLLDLYTNLHKNKMPVIGRDIEQLWQKIIGDENHHIIVAEYEGKLISSCVIVIVPNLTQSQRPYAFIENVITHPDYRNNGFALQILSYARDIAKENNCYKIMLMTGSKEESTIHFYEQAGYNREDKTAFIQWLE